MTDSGYTKEKVLKPPYARMGGKSRLAKQLVEMFPKAETYVEPFFGAGAVFFQIPKGTYPKEIINDLDKDIYNIMKGLQKLSGEKIASMVNGEYTKDEFNALRETEPRTIDAKFARSFTLSRTSYYSNLRNYNKTHNKIKVKFGDEYKNRLKGVKIYNRDYMDIINEYDSPTTFFYFDPPYENSLSIYKHHKFSIDDFFKLVSVLRGKFVLSYNNNPEVIKKAEKYGFKTEIVKVIYPSKYWRKKEDVNASELVVRNFK